MSEPHFGNDREDTASRISNLMGQWTEAMQTLASALAAGAPRVILDRYRKRARLYEREISNAYRLSELKRMHN